MKAQSVKAWAVTYYQELEKAIGNVDSLLDVGCGINSPIVHISRRPAKLIGVDGFQPSIDESRRKNKHDDYVCSDLLDIDKHFEEKSFDCVMALDVVEHFPKEKGLELLDKMEKLASKRVIVFTPNGFLPQDEHSGNVLQKHVSCWSVEEMRQRGYQVIGINGWKPLLGEFALPRFWPKPLWTLISRLTQPLVRNRPEAAFQILCIKHLGQVSTDPLESQVFALR